MPQYVFAKVSNPEVTQDLFYAMKDVPSVGTVITIEGAQWRRCFTKPRMGVDTQCDPHSARDFVKATNKKDSVGSMWDRSKEMSLKRAEKDGVDNVKETFYRDYTRRRKGRVHPEQKREQGVKSLAKKGIRLDYGDDD